METFSTLLAILRGIHRSPVNSPHKGQWHGALMFSLICTRINCWVNIREAGDLRRYRAHYDVIVMKTSQWVTTYGGPYFADNIFKCIFIMFNGVCSHDYILYVGGHWFGNAQLYLISPKYWMMSHWSDVFNSAEETARLSYACCFMTTSIRILPMRNMSLKYKTIKL